MRLSRFTFAILFLPQLAFASSHMDAPLISEDPLADNTDVYAFRSPDAPNTVTIIANYVPLGEPGLGYRSYFGFSDNVRYEIRIDNDRDSVTDIRYDFLFTTGVADGSTFLYNGGPLDGTTTNRNVGQTYVVNRVTSGGTTTLISGAPVSPPNLGPRSNPDPQGAMLAAVQQTGGTKVFAGTADDPFFLDAGALFDLTSVRQPPGNAGGGVDTFAGFNISTIALQIPITDVTVDGEIPPGPADPSDPDGLLGIHSTASRRRTVVRTPGGGEVGSTLFAQVSRVGMPMVNMTMRPVGERDEYNRRMPDTDASDTFFLEFSDFASFLAYSLGIESPPSPPRDDVVNFFYHTTKTPAGGVGDMVRLDVGIPPSANPNRLGQAGGDPAGFPNGRRLSDDVVDVIYSLLVAGDPTAGGPPVAVGDGVDENDKPFLSSFPYVGVPHQGFEHTHHGQ
jgi:hypothetical protein